MTDLHTHILPCMDDGAQSVEEALEMLRMQARQGVDTVALTPHFYRSREKIEDFLARRQNAWDRLQDAVKNQDYPQLLLGAEVAWVSGIADWQELESFCYAGTRMLLIELPMTPWNQEVFRQLYNLEGRRGVIPMIAHLDRYFHCQKKKMIEQLLEMGYPVQVSAEALFHTFERKQALHLIEDADALLISDCHNLKERKPNLESAMKMVEKRLGSYAARLAAENTDDILKD